MLALDRNVARYTWTVVFVLAFIGALYLIRDTLLIFGLSLLFACLLGPIVKFLDWRLPGRSRVWALAIVYVSLIAVLTVIGISIGSQIATQASVLAKQVPDLISKLEQPTQAIASRPLQSLRNRAVSMVRTQLGNHSQDLVSLIPNAVLGALSHAGSLIFIVLVPILSFFFLKDHEQLQTSILGIVPPGPRRNSLGQLADELNTLFAQYMRALVLLAIAAFLANAVFFYLIGVPYGILLAAIAAPLEFIPMIGPLTAAILILTVAGLSGFHHLLWLAAFLAAFRIFQDYVLSPFLLSKGMELHPLVVIFGVLAGASIGGVAGAFLSVPILASLRVVFRLLSRTPNNPSKQDVGSSPASKAL